MSRQLARLLDRKDIAFNIAIKDLEMATGKRNIDVKLVGDVLAKSHHIIHAMGLDNRDLKASELYQALLANKTHRTKKDAEFAGVIVDDKLISLNHRDIDIDRIHKSVFTKRSTAHMQEALKAELIKRYKSVNESNPRNIDSILKVINK